MYRIKIFAKSFLSLFAIMRLSGISTKNPISLVLFMILVYIYTKLDNEKFQSHIETVDPLLAGILSLLFSLFTLSAQHDIILQGMENRFFCAVILLFTGFGLLTTYYHLTIWLLQVTDTLKITKSGYSYAWFPYVTVISCLVCWLPYFLYEYPGVMTPDSINQYAQVIGAYELSNQHSIVHTGFIGLFYNLGLSMTDDPHFGLALYTLAQMFFMAFVAGYVVRTLQLAHVRLLLIVITICFYALMPYNGAYAVTMWKDIPFAGCMTLFAATLMRFLLRGNHAVSSDDIPKLSISEYFTLVLPYIFSCVLLCLLRSNGWYAYIVMLPFILIVYRKCPKSMIPIHLIILLLVLFVKIPVMNVYDISQADFVESLSIPMQQIARVITDGESLSLEQETFLEQIMDLEQIPQTYQPNVSDNIKNLVRQHGANYLETHKAHFFEIWFDIGREHLNAYFDAYVDQTVGYWYPDISCDAGLADGIYANEFGLTWQPIIHGNAIVKTKEILFKLPELIPLYGMLWSIGLMLWLMLLLTALCFRSGKTANALICLPSILLILTLCIATPVSNDFRYAYPVFYALPILLLSPFVEDETLY